MLGFAVARPRGWPEAVAAVPGAGLLVAAGAVRPHAAWEQTRSLLPVAGFLAAVLVLSQLCADDGLFEAMGDLVARRTGGSTQRLLGGVFAVASLTTAVLSLDATVVLLTPVVFVTAARVGARPRPHVFACGHLSNTASLLLPVSNLTNLLALAAGGIGFVRFGALMAAPWVVAIAVEYAVFRWYFAADLAAGESAAGPAAGSPAGAAGARAAMPRFTLAVLGLTLAGFVVTSLAGVNAAWAAAGGAVVLAVRALARRRITPVGVVRAANPLFCLFVLALGVVVTGVVDNGLADGIGRLLPSGSGFPELLAVACVAAVLANVINNLPAVLALLPLVAGAGAVAGGAGPGPVLAVLLGVNLGPNLTYAGSLATLLWRRILSAHETEPRLADFTRLGALTVPATLLAATAALWAALRVIGG